LKKENHWNCNDKNNPFFFLLPTFYINVDFQKKVQTEGSEPFSIKKISIKEFL